MNFFTELTKRWSADSPAFFKKLMTFGTWLVSTGVALTAVPATLEEMIPKEVNFDLSLLVTISSYMVLSGVILSIVAKLPADDPEQLK